MNLTEHRACEFAHPETWLTLSQHPTRRLVEVARFLALRQPHTDRLWCTSSIQVAGIHCRGLYLLRFCFCSFLLLLGLQLTDVVIEVGRKSFGC